MGFAVDELSTNANGGTELIKRELEKLINPELLDKVQIFASRVRNPDPHKHRIFYAHDLPDDPESHFLKDGGWQMFNKLVFVSNWQMQNYIKTYDIPWSKCIVILNAINPIEHHEKPSDVIRIGYWSTPHRGLNILVPVFESLQKKYGDKIVLDVCSSFELYGWPERDKEFQPLFDRCRENPQITYNKTMSNDDLRERLKTIHILGYPSIWPETSCRVLLEAMSAKILSVHSNYGALFETGSKFTTMYTYNEDLQTHANIFYHTLDNVIEIYGNENVGQILDSAKNYIDTFHNWKLSAQIWEALLTSIVHEPIIEIDTKQTFSYKVP